MVELFTTQLDDTILELEGLSGDEELCGVSDKAEILL